MVWFKVRKAWFSWFSFFHSLVIGVLWLLPILKDCSAPLDPPVTFYAWSLLPFWQYYPSKLHALIKISSLLCLSSHVFLYVFSEDLSTWPFVNMKFSVHDHLSTWASISNFLRQEKLVASPFAPKLVTWFTVQSGPVCWFYCGRTICF